ncbi:16552_t:CDS:2, partial [Dentiscutata erythropus]
LKKVLITKTCTAAIPTITALSNMANQKILFSSNNVLEVNYKYQGDGSDLGSLYFEYEEDMLDKHLKRSIIYWKGDREPEGVPIEEAWKC